MNDASLQQLKAVIGNLQASGKRVVFTNGVFDLIHTGHIRYLRAARNMGDCLIVGVNSDQSVRRLKGENRPILSERERIKILASFEFVDYAVIFDESTPLDLIKTLRPRVLIKGADYTLDTIVGRDEVEGWGGEVCTVELVDGVSTSEIIQRIVRSQ